MDFSDPKTIAALLLLGGLVLSFADRALGKYPRAQAFVRFVAAMLPAALGHAPVPPLPAPASPEPPKNRSEA